MPETATVSIRTLPVSFPLPTISQSPLFTLFCPLILDHGACLIIFVSGLKILHSQIVGGVNSSRERDSSIGGGTGIVCLGVVYMEEEVQDRAQVEVGREEQGEGETHGKEQSEEQRERTDDQPLTMDILSMR